MKYGIDIGHNCPPDVGAADIENEDKLNLNLGNNIMKKLRNLGNEVICCTPRSASSVGNSLAQRVSIADRNKVDLYLSIHFNMGGGTGTKIFVNMLPKALKVGKNILNEVVNLGYLDGGINDGHKLYVIRNIKAPAVLIYCCYIDSKEDMKRFNEEEMAVAIVSGLIK